MVAKKDILDEFLVNDGGSKQLKSESPKIEEPKPESAKKVKPVAKKKPVTKQEGKTAEPKPVGDNQLFTLVIVAVVILGIIGLVFGYTKDKISELKKGGTEVEKGLETKVNELNQQLTDMKDKTETLEKQNQAQKEVVLDLFDKNRTFPTKVNAEDWLNLDDKGYSFTVSFPSTWEFVKPIVEEPAADQKTKAEIAFLQPVGVANFTNAITIKTDYSDFAALKLTEKVSIFEELDLLDTRDFENGTLMYFINFDKDNNEIPTVLVLTNNNIYRATFNINDKSLDGYFEYRKNFEEIMTTFALSVSAPASTTEKKQ